MSNATKTTRQDVTLYNAHDCPRAVSLCRTHDTPAQRRAGTGHAYPRKSHTTPMSQWFCDACPAG